MHQYENYDDNAIPAIPEHTMLSTAECNERVYPEFMYKIAPDACIEPVDKFMKRMTETYEIYSADMWLVDDESMFMERGMYCTEDSVVMDILDCDKMGSEVNTIIENMRGGY